MNTPRVPKFLFDAPIAWLLQSLLRDAIFNESKATGDKQMALSLGTAKTFHILCGGLREAKEFEEQVLNSGREFLPQSAIDVLDGEGPTDEYFAFLTEQFNEAQKENQ